MLAVRSIKNSCEISTNLIPYAGELFARDTQLYACHDTHIAVCHDTHIAVCHVEKETIKMLESTRKVLEKENEKLKVKE